MTFEQKQRWFWYVRRQATAQDMTPPSQDALQFLFEELEKAWTALEYYQDETIYRDDSCYLMTTDRGKRAREALNA